MHRGHAPSSPPHPPPQVELSQVGVFQFYRALNVRVALTGMEIWSERDQIRVEKNPSTTLSSFLEWRRRELLPRFRHDNAQLIM